MKILILSSTLIFSLLLFGCTEDKPSESIDSKERIYTEVNNKNLYKPISEEGKNENAVGIGMPLEVGDSSFTLNGIELVDYVGPLDLPTEPKGKFLVFDVSFKNNGNKAVTLDTNLFKLIKNNNTFNIDQTASTVVNQNKDGKVQKNLFLQDINPGIEIACKIVFDIDPNFAEAANLQLQIQDEFNELGIIVVN